MSKKKGDEEGDEDYKWFMICMTIMVLGLMVCITVKEVFG